MQMFGRRVIPTTLDEIPRAFRAAPGVLALNQAELAALQRNDGPTFKRILEIVQAEDMADATLQMRRSVKRPKGKIGPSTRLSMLNAIYQGRK